MDRWLLHDYVGHGASLASILAYFTGVLPSIALVMAILWYAVLLWESKTGQGWRIRCKNAFYHLHHLLDTPPPPEDKP